MGTRPRGAHRAPHPPPTGPWGRPTCLVKSWMMLCSDTWEPMAKRRLSCFSMRLSNSWSSWLVKPSTPMGRRRGTGTSVCLNGEAGGLERRRPRTQEEQPRPRRENERKRKSVLGDDQGPTEERMTGTRSQGRGSKGGRTPQAEGVAGAKEIRPPPSLSGTGAPLTVVSGAATRGL